MWLFNKIRGSPVNFPDTGTHSNPSNQQASHSGYLHHESKTMVQIIAGHCEIPGGCPVHCLKGTAMSELEDRSTSFCLRCYHPMSFHASSGTRENLGSQNLSYAKDPFNCPRDETVKGIWYLLKQHRVVHIRGTPASGKTTLSLLLLDYITKNVQDHYPVRLDSWPKYEKIQLGGGHRDVLLRAAMEAYNNLYVDRNTLMNHQRIIFLIDEAQGSYHDQGLWNDCLKLQSDRKQGPFFILFSSFGSASSMPVRFDDGSAPMVLSPEQRISIKPTEEQPLSLFFDRNEFQDLINRICADEKEKFHPEPDLIQYLWDITGGHPGASKSLLRSLIQSSEMRDFVKCGKKVSLRDAERFLLNNTRVFECLFRTSFRRSLPDFDLIKGDPGIIAVLEKVVVEQYVKGDIGLDPPLNMCYKMGYLQAEKPEPIPERAMEGETFYVFPTLIHKKYCEHYLMAPGDKFPISSFPNLLSLWTAAISKFSGDIVSRFGPTASKRPLEAVYQDELYRSLFVVLGQKIFVDSEWSGTSGAGRVDFRIRAGVDKSWAIEVLRDGEDIEDHCRRFMPRGRYSLWVQSNELTDYVVLDFRSNTPRKSRDIPYLYHIIIEDKCATFLDSNLKVVKEKFRLVG